MVTRKSHRTGIWLRTSDQDPALATKKQQQPGVRDQYFGVTPRLKNTKEYMSAVSSMALVVLLAP
jgi:hypothetical protein